MGNFALQFQLFLQARTPIHTQRHTHAHCLYIRIPLSKHLTSAYTLPVYIYHTPLPIIIFSLISFHSHFLSHFIPLSLSLSKANSTLKLGFCDFFGGILEALLVLITSITRVELQFDALITYITRVELQFVALITSITRVELQFVALITSITRVELQFDA